MGKWEAEVEENSTFAAGMGRLSWGIEEKAKAETEAEAKKKAEAKAEEEEEIQRLLSSRPMRLYSFSSHFFLSFLEKLVVS